MNTLKELEEEYKNLMRATRGALWRNDSIELEKISKEMEIIDRKIMLMKALEE